MRKVLPIFVFMFLVFYGTSAVYPEYEWNSDLGKFVKVGTVFYGTPEEQYTYARNLAASGKISKAIEAYSYIYMKFPDTEYAVKAIMKIAELYEKKKDYYHAFKHYRKIVQYYPQSKYLNKVYEKELKIGNLFLSGEKAKFYGLPILPALSKAIEVYSAIVESAPYSKYGMKAQYKLALAYRKKGKFRESIAEFQKFIDNYPDSEYRGEAFYQIADITYRLSMRRGRDRKLMQEAKRRLREFIEMYSGNSDAVKSLEKIKALEARDAEKLYEAAIYYENQGYPKSALIYYNEIIKNYPDVPVAEKAKRRLSYIKNPKEAFVDNQKALEELNNEYAELLKRAKHGGNKSEVGKKIKDIKLKLKEIERQKKADLELRWRELRRKECDLKRSKRELKEKKKSLKGRKYSPDMERFIRQWEQSIVDEEYRLRMERRELLTLENKLGVGRLFHREAVANRSYRRKIDGYKKRQLNKLYAKEAKLIAKKSKVIKELSLLVSGIDADFLNANKGLYECFLLIKDRGAVAGAKKLVERESDDVGGFPDAGELKSGIESLRNKIKLLEEVRDYYRSLKGNNAGSGTGGGDREFRKKLISIEKEVKKYTDMINDAEAEKAEIMEEIDKCYKESVSSKGMLYRSCIVAVKPLYYFGRGAYYFIFGIKPRDAAYIEKADKLTEKKISPKIRKKLAELRGRLEELDNDIAEYNASLLACDAELTLLSNGMDENTVEEKIEDADRELSMLNAELAELEAKLKVVSVSGAPETGDKSDDKVLCDDGTPCVTEKGEKYIIKKSLKLKEQILSIENDEIKVIEDIKDILSEKILLLKSMEKDDPYISDAEIRSMRKKLFKEFDDINTYYIKLKEKCSHA